MRSTTAFVSLLVAAASSPITFAAPIRGGRSAEWERRVAAMAGSSSLRVHTLSPEAAAALADESGPSPDVIDNRHYMPSGLLPPSAVLADHRPIETTYLMGLSATTVRGSTTTGNDAAKSTEAPVLIRVYDTHDGMEVVIVDADIEAAIGADAKAVIGTTPTAPVVAAEPIATNKNAPSDADLPESLKMESRPPRHKAHGSELPCHYAQLRRDYNDMMVISLVAVFLLVIVAVELWDSSSE